MSWLSNLFAYDGPVHSDDSDVIRVNGKSCIKVLAENVVVGSLLSNGHRVRGIKIYTSLKEVHIYHEASHFPDTVSVGNLVYVVKE